MQPANSPKPAMDVTVPKSPTMPAPTAQKPQPAVSTPVHQAPIEAQGKPPIAKEASIDDSAAPDQKQSSPQTQENHDAVPLPIGAIIGTILVVIVLSLITVFIFVKSQ